MSEQTSIKGRGDVQNGNNVRTSSQKNKITSLDGNRDKDAILRAIAKEKKKQEREREKRGE